MGDVDYRALYPAGEDTGNKRLTHCWAHEDDKPSMSINLVTGVYKCFGCGEAGNGKKYITAELKGSPKDYGIGNHIPESRVNELHAALLINKEVMAYLTQTRGITRKVLKQYKVGYCEEKQRIAIPIFDESGGTVNIRFYLPNCPKGTPKFLNETGRGAAVLHPIRALAEESITLVAGETDLLVALSNNINAITGTAGETTFKKEWAELFKNKQVAICYDIDDAGTTSANNVARLLHPIARTVKLVSLQAAGLSIDKHPHGDLSDYFNEMSPRATGQDFKNLVKSTPLWKPEGQTEDIIDPMEDEEVYEVPFSSVSRAQYGGRRIQFKTHVSGKDKVPYLIPGKVTMTCGENAGSLCNRCACSGSGGKVTKEFIGSDPRVLSLFRCSELQQKGALREAFGIPPRCGQYDLTVERYANIEEVHLTRPNGTEHNYSDLAYVEHHTRLAFNHYVSDSDTDGNGMEWNTEYDVTARVTREPTRGYAISLIDRAVRRDDDLSAFSLSKGDGDLLARTFTVRECSTQGLTTKLADITTDIESNVTHIFGRPDLHLSIDLTYHSVLGFNWHGKLVRGYLDTLLVGDTRQGKSEAASGYRRHYQLGDKIDCSRATIAGLIAGATELANGHWSIEWGVYPINDRRLIILEEAKALSPEQIGALKEVRSSGMAEVTAIKRDRSPARVRALWIANPRSPRKVNAFSYGIEVVRELIGDPENIARFDLICMVADMEEELSREALFSSFASQTAVPHVYTTELCKMLIMWVWSRRADQVVFAQDTESFILELSKEMSSKYDDSFPLIQPADFRFKLARVAIACAARVFSTDSSYQNIVVHPYHVQWAADFIDSLYTKRSMGYDTYSVDHRRANSIDDPKAIVDALGQAGDPAYIVETLLQVNLFNLTQIADWLGVDKEQARPIVHALLRNRAIASYDTSRFRKSPGFITLLRTLQAEGFKRKELKRRD